MVVKKERGINSLKGKLIGIASGVKYLGEFKRCKMHGQDIIK